MQTSDYLCRKATASDDAAMIAKYLYLTDPYIYPSICQDPADPMWVALIRECLQTQDDLYQLEHISVVLFRGQIVGVACVIPCGKSLAFAKNMQQNTQVRHKLQSAMEGYFLPMLAEAKGSVGYSLTNFCIDGDHQGKGIGSLFLSHCVETYGSQPMHLDVIAANQSAVRLYEKAGFRIEKHYSGFTGSEVELPCYHMVFLPKTESVAY